MGLRFLSTQLLALTMVNSLPVGFVLGGNFARISYIPAWQVISYTIALFVASGASVHVGQLVGLIIVVNSNISQMGFWSGMFLPQKPKGPLPSYKIAPGHAHDVFLTCRIVLRL